MQQKKEAKRSEKLKKEIQAIRIGFIKQGSSLNRFCTENRINASNVYKLFSGRWVSGDKHDELKNRLINASKGKTDFLTKQSSSQAE